MHKQYALIMKNVVEDRFYAVMLHVAVSCNIRIFVMFILPCML